jgi:hypothetical protein
MTAEKSEENRLVPEKIVLLDAIVASGKRAGRRKAGPVNRSLTGL